jgi:SAM-dependent methyltransferase
MDAAALTLPDDSFDAAISVFGVVLLPDTEAGMRELARVVKPGAPVAIVTWTETHRYELATRLLDAIAAIRGPLPPPKAMPAQLRYQDPVVFRALLASADLDVRSITPIEERWTLPSALWIARNIAFAPGMAAMVDGLGADRGAVLQHFVTTLERDRGAGEVTLSAVAHVGIGTTPDR